MPKKIKGVLRIIIHWLLARVPAETFEGLVYRLVAHRMEAVIPPDEALRLLFRLDQRFYGLQSGKAIEYGGGIHTKHRHIRYHEFFVERVSSDESVLDIGCGNGAVAYDVASKKGATVLGIDLNSENISFAQTRHRHPCLRFLVGDALKDLPDGDFDIVILSNVIEHIEKRVRFLQRINREINPNRLLFRVPLFQRDWRVPLKKELGVDYRLDPTHFIEYSQEEFFDELTQARLTVTHYEVRWGEIWAEAIPDG